MPGVDVQFLVDVLDVRADGVQADAQIGSAFLIGAAAGEKLEDFVLLGGEGGQIFRGLAREFLDDLAGDAAAHRRPALLDLPNGASDVRGLVPLQQVADRAGPEGIEDQVVIVEGRQHQELGPDPLGRELSNQFDAIPPREMNVRQHHVGFQSGKGCGRGFGVPKPADDRKIRFSAQLRLQFPAEAGVVLDDGNADLPLSGGIGSGGLHGQQGDPVRKAAKASCHMKM